MKKSYGMARSHSQQRALSARAIEHGSWPVFSPTDLFPLIAPSSRHGPQAPEGVYLIPRYKLRPSTKAHILRSAMLRRSIQKPQSG